MSQPAARVKRAKKEIVGRELESKTLVYTVPAGLLPEGCKRVAVFEGDNLKKRLPKTRFKQAHELCDGLFASTNRIDYVRFVRVTQTRTNIEVQLKAGLKATDLVKDKIHSALERLGDDFTVSFKA